MAVAEQEQQEQSGVSAHSTALKAAAAAAATGAATYAVKKAMSHGDSGGSGENGRERRERESGGSSSQGSSLLASAGASAWEAASGALLPMAEDAAEAAGKYLAQKAPDVVRERIVPRFIEAFNEAS
jgi:hypothetical protein